MQLNLRIAWSLSLSLIALLLATSVNAQTVDSGSDGSDGALTFPAGAGNILFDPSTFSPPLDPDGDGVYHFTTITVPAGTTVKLRTSVLEQGKPIVWLASGDIVIEGTLDLNGEKGSNWDVPAAESIAGAGGYNGSARGAAGRAAVAGGGPGGGFAPPSSASGGSAAHVVTGTGSGSSSSAVYGNDFLLPILGGSGGSGASLEGAASNSSGGGAGGGALLLVSSTLAILNGTVSVNGGQPGATAGNIGSRPGGGGSGGAVRIIAPRVEGSGTVTALGGGGGSVGRIRLEAFVLLGPATANPGPSVGTPGPIFLPTTAPAIRVVRIDGVAVIADPSGSFTIPDVTIDAGGSVTIEIEASGIPPGTVIDLILDPETGDSVTATSSPLAGTVAASTATATVTFASGFSRIFVKASWTP